MKKVIITLFAVTFLAGFVGFANGEEREKIGHKGNKGLSFSVSGVSNVKLGELEGGIGGKFWISDELVTVVAIGFDYDENISVQSSPDYSDYKRTEGNFSLFAGLEDHFLFKDKFSPYAGAGILIGVVGSTYYPGLRLPPNPGITEKEKRSSKKYGIRGFCGLEYFFSNWISLAAQYQIDYCYWNEDYQSILVEGPNVVQPPKKESTRTTFDTGTSSLILTFYIW